MWYNVGPHLKRRMLAEQGHDRAGTTFFSSGNGVDEFKAVLRSKYGSLSRAWRVGLDADNSGALDFREFCQALRDLGYIGNIRTLWFNLDSENSGSVTLKELDPQAAHALEKFRALSTTRYGSIPEMFKRALDQDHSGTVALAEFVEASTALGYTDELEVAELFSYLLLRPGCRFITLEDIMFLQSWEDTKRKKAEKSRLRTNWVNKDPYLLLTPNNSVMSSLVVSDAVSVYSDQVGVDIEKQKDDFRQFLIQRYGSLSKAFSAMDVHHSGELSLVAFQTTVSSVLRYCRIGDASRLFLAFSGSLDSQLTWQHLGITRNEWMNHVLERQMKNEALRRQAKEAALAPLGRSPRMVEAERKHEERIRDKKSKGLWAFGSPLPPGWGFPEDGFLPREPNHGFKLPAVPHTVR